MNFRKVVFTWKDEDGFDGSRRLEDVERLFNSKKKEKKKKNRADRSGNCVHPLHGIDFSRLIRTIDTRLTRNARE